MAPPDSPPRYDTVTKIYRACEDPLCVRDSSRSMQSTLRFLQTAPIHVAYLQGCIGMAKPRAFCELVKLITTHPTLWAVNLGELSGYFNLDLMQELLTAIRNSNVVSIYYDQGRGCLDDFKHELKVAIRANRSKHLFWKCDGDDDPVVIKNCTHMFYHPRRFAANRPYFERVE